MRNRTALFLLSAVLSAQLSAQLAAQTATQLPKQIGPPSDPVWVSASLALRNGRLQPEYLNPSQFEGLSAALTGPIAVENQGCVLQLKRHIEPYPAPPDSLEEFVRSATTIALAVVEEVDSGFWLGHPSTLLRLGISKTTGPDGPTTGTVLVFLMQGNVQTEEGLLCGNFSNRSLPERGDQVHLISIRPIEWSAQEPSLLFPGEYFFVGPKASIPPAVYARELNVEPENTLNSLLEEADLRRSKGGLP